MKAPEKKPVSPEPALPESALEHAARKYFHPDTPEKERAQLHVKLHTMMRVEDGKTVIEIPGRAPISG